MSFWNCVCVYSSIQDLSPCFEMPLHVIVIMSVFVLYTSIHHTSLFNNHCAAFDFFVTLLL